MKLYAECISCQVQVRFRDIERLVDDEDKRIEIVKNIIRDIDNTLSKCLNRHDSRCIPTYIAANLFRYLKNVTGVKDPYRTEKRYANEEALKLYLRLKEFIDTIPDLDKKIFMALKISLAGNILDIGVAGYISPDISNVVEFIKSIEVYGNIDDCIKLLLNSKKIVVIMDNAGEAVLDRVLADILRSRGKYVIAVVKGRAFQNDITIEEISETELDKSFDKIIDTGTDASSIFLEEAKKEAVDVLRNSDVIISKGMANYEYISEVENIIGRPIIYMLIAKCRPIAKDLGVPLGKAVIRISKPINFSTTF